MYGNIFLLLINMFFRSSTCNILCKHINLVLSNMKEYRDVFNLIHDGIFGMK